MGFLSLQDVLDGLAGIGKDSPSRQFQNFILQCSFMAATQPHLQEELCHSMQTKPICASP
jgi:hypothetical protein